MNLAYIHRVFFATAALAGAALSSHAQDASPSTPGQPPSAGYREPLPRLDGDMVSHKDKAFLEKAGRSGQKEVAVSEAVLSKLTTSAAREFATMMIRDHKKANVELEDLANKKAVSLPPADSKIAKKWSEKSGDVDKDYLKEMVSDHEEAVKLFEEGAKSKDTDIAAFASKTLPTLRAHLELAKGNKSAAHDAH